MPIPIPRLDPPSILGKVLGRKTWRRLNVFIVATLIARPGDTFLFVTCLECASVFAVPVDPAARRLHEAGVFREHEAYPNLHGGDRRLVSSGRCRRCSTTGIGRQGPAS